MQHQAPKFFNAPNLVSLSRIPLAGLALAARRKRSRLLQLGAIAGFTDLLDGWLARRAGSRPHPAGAWLDPLCDKIFVLSALGAAAAFQRQYRMATALIATRELVQGIVVSPYLLRLLLRGYPYRDINFKAAALGKATTVAQFAAIGAMLAARRGSWMRKAVMPLSVVAGAVGTLAAFNYFTRVRRETTQRLKASRASSKSVVISEGANGPDVLSSAPAPAIGAKQ